MFGDDEGEELKPRRKKKVKVVNFVVEDNDEDDDEAAEDRRGPEYIVLDDIPNALGNNIGWSTIVNAMVHKRIDPNLPWTKW